MYHHDGIHETDAYVIKCAIIITNRCYMSVNYSEKPAPSQVIDFHGIMIIQNIPS